MNAASTPAAAFMVTVQAPVPLHAPLQLVKVEPLAGVGVSVTRVAWLKLALQVAPQLIPAGALVTVPVPLPLLVVVSKNCVGGGPLPAKVAVAVMAPLMARVQLPVPLHAPLQPVKV